MSQNENRKSILMKTAGNIFLVKEEIAGQRRYLDVALADGQPITDVWSIGVLTSSSKERIGYPTQKPEALLEQVI